MNFRSVMHTISVAAGCPVGACSVACSSRFRSVAPAGIEVSSPGISSIKSDAIALWCSPHLSSEPPPRVRMYRRKRLILGIVKHCHVLVLCLGALSLAPIVGVADVVISDKITSEGNADPGDEFRSALAVDGGSVVTVS